ncbi:MAG: TIR domain-containing protein [Bdellovibrionia bacterium]
MTLRTKTYIAFNADPETGDMKSYNLMKAWKERAEINFDFENAHDLNTVKDGTSEATIKAKLRARMNTAKLFVLLVGTNTKYHHKFVTWEIELALEAGIPIIVCNINGKKEFDDELCPVVLRDQLAMHVPFRSDVLQYSFTNWPIRHTTRKSEGVKKPRNWDDSVYRQLDQVRADKELARQRRLGLRL